MKICSNYLSTYRLLDCLDLNEYAALTDLKKDAVRLIVSASHVNFAEDSPCRALLLNIVFPEGTNTHTAIKAATEAEVIPGG